MNLNRRKFLKVTASACGASVVTNPVKALATTKLTTAEKRGDGVSVLVDTTKCIGCRSCEAACNEANQLPKPEVDLFDQSVFESKRQTDAKAYTVVNAYPDPKVSYNPTSMGERITVKTQCMHCQEPACASACFVKALEKTTLGPVVYHEERCVGCRYCMVACPFTMTKFEWAKAIPAIRKCIFCYERQLAGQVPACVEACPVGTLTFGKRKGLLEVARTRIYQNPDKYVRHIYGEHEVGGTSWLYISSVPFESFGFRTDLGTKPYPELTKGFLSAVPLVLILWPALLMGCYSFSKQKEQSRKAEEVVMDREEM